MGFDFASSEINEALVQQLHRCDFLNDANNIALAGGPGTGKTHIATALGVHAIEHHHKRVRFFSTVELVNSLEQQKAQGKSVQIANRLVHSDLVILDKLGYLPFSAGGGGALADLGSHVVATARYLVGPIAQVLGDIRTVITERPQASGSKTRRNVEVEDIGRAFVRFENGATGCIQANWIETGRKMQHDFAISGSRGGIAFSQERFNELDLYLTSDAQGRSGFRKIFAGPAHEPYGAFCVAPGH